MSALLRLSLAQINPVMGDLRGNRDLIAEAMAGARRLGAQIVVLPELALTGYPPEDLLFRKSFVRKYLRLLRSLESSSRGLLAVIGHVDEDRRGRIYNAASVLSGGRRIACYRKIELPNYGVFDEKRYFTPGTKPVVLDADGIRIGLTICEDIWIRQSFAYRPPFAGSVSLLINLSASPYHQGKQRFREHLIQGLARRARAAVAYNNLLGGQDELVFDGGGMIADARGRVAAAAPLFEEAMVTADISVPSFSMPVNAAGGLEVFRVRLPRRPAKKAPSIQRPPKLVAQAEVYRALTLGTRDYIKKNGFKKVLIGLSGGIDSALVARIAVDALGAPNVIGVTMPSRFTSPETLSDSWELARRLGIECLEIPIEKPHAAMLELLAPLFTGHPENIAEENLQARLRGNLLMALSNKFGHLVLTTGNKSEMATGYCTLYGDMAGGFAVIKDVPKTLVFKLARWRNLQRPKYSIPATTIRRAPTAELRHGQKDQDTLPPYPVLDRILERYVENDDSVGELLRAGHPGDLVRKIARMVDRNEYKRRQAPPGIKITPKAFGRDRRMPITNRYGL